MGRLGTVASPARFSSSKVCFYMMEIAVSFEAVPLAVPIHLQLTVLV